MLKPVMGLLGLGTGLLFMLLAGCTQSQPADGHPAGTDTPVPLARTVPSPAATATPTAATVPTDTATATPTAAPTYTPVPAATFTPEPTATPTTAPTHTPVPEPAGTPCRDSPHLASSGFPWTSTPPGGKHSTLSTLPSRRASATSWARSCWRPCWTGPSRPKLRGSSGSGRYRYSSVWTLKPPCPSSSH